MSAENELDPYQQFMLMHKNQLESSVVPQHFWPTLYKKITGDVSMNHSMYRIKGFLSNREEAFYSIWLIVLHSNY